MGYANKRPRRRSRFSSAVKVKKGETVRFRSPDDGQGYWTVVRMVRTRRTECFWDAEKKKWTPEDAECIETKSEVEIVQGEGEGKITKRVRADWLTTGPSLIEQIGRLMKGAAPVAEQVAHLLKIRSTQTEAQRQSSLDEVGDYLQNLRWKKAGSRIRKEIEPVLAVVAVTYRAFGEFVGTTNNHKRWMALVVEVMHEMCRVGAYVMPDEFFGSDGMISEGLFAKLTPEQAAPIITYMHEHGPGRGV